MKRYIEKHGSKVQVLVNKKQIKELDLKANDVKKTTFYYRQTGYASSHSN